MTEADRLLDLSIERRAQAWRTWGELEEDVLGHLINPAFMGGPRWPALRQAFRVARRGDAVLVASDGLSDPFDNGEGPDGVNGFGLECFAVSTDPIDTVQGSWLFDIVWQMSQVAASRGNLADLLDRLGLITTELYDVAIPEKHRPRFVNAEGRVGVIVGISEAPIPREIDGPLSPIRLASVKLLTLSEVSFAVSGKDEGRRELARRFASPVFASSLVRRSVVPEA